MTAVWRSRRGRAACLAVIFVSYVATIGAHGQQATRLWDHGTHTSPAPDERVLRELLAAYSAGDVEGAVRGVLAHPPRWMPAVLDVALRRIEEETKHHRRPESRLGAAQDERLERYLRADRLNVLLLAAALQLEASLAAADVAAAGRHVVDSERAIDSAYALRADFERNGPVPWPVAVDEPWQSVTRDARQSQRFAGWPAVRDFVRRWYGAAISRMQALVEVRLGPGLVARGLARFPADPDLLVARGSLVETRLALAQVDSSLAAILYSPEVRQRWRGELSDAERDFEQAAQSAGLASEAAIRLARVRLLKEQKERAADLLDRVLARETPGHLRYLTLLFRAAAAEQSGDAPAAIRHYEAAVDTIPAAQPPMLALGRIADERNQPALARRWVERALGAEMRAADPWRRYIQGQAWQLGERLASLRTLEPQ